MFSSLGCGLDSLNEGQSNCNAQENKMLLSFTLFCNFLWSLRELIYVPFYLQVYSPNYVLPPKKCCSEEMAMDLRYLLLQPFIF